MSWRFHFPIRKCDFNTSIILVVTLVGSERFLMDISIMLSSTPSRWWELNWKYFTPLLITVRFLRYTMI